MIEPTAEQCSEHAVMTLDDGRTGYACWYPQMGGYVGKCVIAEDDGCFEAWVWHDGDFPFGGDEPDGWGEIRSPRHLHHCNPDQFIGFGQTVNRLLG